MSNSKIENPVRKVNPKLVMEGTLKKIKRNFPKNNGTTLMCEKFLAEHPKLALPFIDKVMDIVIGGMDVVLKAEAVENEILGEILDPSTHQPVEDSDGK